MKYFHHWFLASVAVIGLLITSNLFTQAQQTAEGDIQIEIQEGNSCCVYGTSVVFGEKDVSLGVTEFTGDFLSYHGTTTRGCRDLLGTETGRAMYISMSGDMENQNGNKISSGNVKISFDETQLIGGDCVLYNNSGVDVPLNSSVALIEKDGNISANYGKICELATTNVQLKVVTNTGQAPGNYQGTLVIDLPNFANATCDSELIGTFYDAETDGLAYEGDQGSVGITSNGGQFTYKPGEQITFKVGNVILGNPVIPEVNGSVFVTDLFGLGRTEITDPNVIEVGRLLQGLDEDSNPENGISISGVIATSFTENVNITELNVENKLTSIGKQILPSKYIVEHLENTAETKLDEVVDVSYSWILTGGGLQDEGGQSIIVDGLGNIHIVGNFQGTASFGNTALVSSGGYDVLVAEINNSGDRIDVVKGGGRAHDYIANMGGMGGMGIDGLGNKYIVGTFYQSIYGDTTFGDTTLSGDFSYNGFIAKLDNNGNWVRAKKYGNDGTQDVSKGIAVDGSGNSYIIGTFNSSLTLGTTTLNNSGMNDIFIAKMDTNGTWVWAKKGGGISEDSIKSIKLDNLGNIYILGHFTNTGVYGLDILTGNGYNGFIAKMGTNGDWIWAKKGGRTLSDSIEGGISIDGLGNVYIASQFQGTASFGDTILVSSGGYDILIAKMDTNGDWVWAKKGGGFDDDLPSGIAVDGSGNSYVIGTFMGSTNFGSNSLVSRIECEESCPPEGFITKIDTNGNWISSYVMEGFYMSDIFVDTEGYIYTLGTFGLPLVLGFDLYEPVDMYQNDLMIYKISPRDISEPLLYDELPVFGGGGQT